MNGSEQTEDISRQRSPNKGLYLIPSAFTATNMAMGLYAITLMFKGFQLLANPTSVGSATAYFNSAAQAILLAFIFDSLDGRIARATKTTTKIGLQLDSLADMITFCVAPAVLVYVWSFGSVDKDNNLAKLGLFVSFFYIFSGAFRLSRFNIQGSRPRVLREGSAKLDKKSFVGLPTPAAAALIASIVYFAPTPLISYGAVATYYSRLMVILIACLSLLMISTLRYLSFKDVGFSGRLKVWVVLLFFALGVIIWFYSRSASLILWSIYVLHGPVRRLGSALRRQPQSSIEFVDDQQASG